MTRHTGLSEEEEWQMKILHRLHQSQPAAPKDIFPLPRIDHMVDATAGHKLLSFMDAYCNARYFHQHNVKRVKDKMYKFWTNYEHVRYNGRVTQAIYKMDT